MPCDELHQSESSATVKCRASVTHAPWCPERATEYTAVYGHAGG